MAQELNASEKFMEKSIIVERFFKRYKIQIISAFVFVRTLASIKQSKIAIILLDMW